MKYWKILFVIVFAASGCASSEPSELTKNGTGPLLGLESDPHRAPWAEWTAAPGRSVPGALGNTMTRFDGWRTAEADVVEEAWRGVFSVLDELSRSLEAAGQTGLRSARTYRAVMHLLEPRSERQSPVVMEATYLVRRASYGGDPREGLAVRFYRSVERDGAQNSKKGTASSLTVWMTREASGARAPDRIAIWAQSGFREAGAATSAFLERSDGSNQSPWKLIETRPGLVMPDWSGRTTATEQPASTSSQPNLELVPRILIDNLWKPNVGPSYAASNRTPKDAEGPPAPMEAFLGLEDGDRGIKRVYSNSVFPPRPDLGDLE